MNDPSEMNRLEAIEEFKLACAERRFIMERFIQAITIYLALSGFAYSEMLKAPTQGVLMLMELGFVGLLPIALYAANHFKQMYIHCAERLSVLADFFGFQRDYDLRWGYRGALLVVVISQLLAVTIVVIRLFSNFQGS